jgi:hypothetical protein
MASATQLAQSVGDVIGRVGRRARSASAGRAWVAPRVVVPAFLLLILSVGFVVGLGGTAAPLGHGRAGQQGPRAAERHHAATRSGSARLADDSGNASLSQLGASGAALLPPATGAPTPDSSAAADQPPLAAHENFAFAPYWTLGQAPTFDITGLSTIAYFSIGVNPDGTLAESGAGWSGFESQDLVDLISRAHAAGERVVLTVNDFGQSSLDALTSSPTAAGSLSAALIPLLQAKSLDGVNFDFEGDGSGDQAGLTNLIAAVSTALRSADSHWQITMDTYASSAGDAGGFYDIPALARSVDAFFVMDYELNLAASPSATSPLTSSAFSSLTTLEQYAKAVPVSKVILGLPFFGIDWPTTNGTMAARAAGPAADIADSEAQGNGPQYWDPVTATSWTSYLVGSQWHESYYEGEYGLYQAGLAATRGGARGVGIWALGMESDGAQMVAAMDGIDPGQPASTGPPATSASPSPTTASAPPTAGGQGGTGVGGGSGGASSPTTTTAPAPPSTTAPPPTTTTTTLAPYASGTFNGAPVLLTPVAADQVTPFTGDGSLTAFSTNEPAYACLNGATIAVYWDGLLSSQLVAVAVTPTNCMTQDFLLPSSS